MNMIEKVAKALYPMFDADCECNRCLTAKNDAKSAIAAMREPSEEMIEAGYDIKGVYDAVGEDLPEVWSKMIDAALKDS